MGDETGNSDQAY